jgi:hypothetical protein
MTWKICFERRLDHVQQPGRARAVTDRCQIDDDGDVLVPAAGVAPNMLINTNDLHPIEAVRVIDQHTPTLGQNGVVRGIPRHAQALGNPGHRQMLPRS